jgi:hypothetical protein
MHFTKTTIGICYIKITHKYNLCITLFLLEPINYWLTKAGFVHENSRRKSNDFIFALSWLYMPVLCAHGLL